MDCYCDYYPVEQKGLGSERNGADSRGRRGSPHGGKVLDFRRVRVGQRDEQLTP